MHTVCAFTAQQQLSSIDGFCGPAGSMLNSIAWQTTLVECVSWHARGTGEDAALESQRYCTSAVSRPKLLGTCRVLAAPAYRRAFERYLNTVQVTLWLRLAANHLLCCLISDLAYLAAELLSGHEPDEQPGQPAGAAAADASG